MTAPGKRVPVIFNHSAAIDDFVATALLLTMPDIEIKGIVVTNADCIADPAMNTSWRVSRFFGIENDIPLTLSMARGWNAFPWEYRSDCITMGTIDCLKPYTNNPKWPPYPSGEDMLVTLLQEAVDTNTPAKVLCTGPVTSITNIVSQYPHLLKGIDEIIWMGGAIYVPGNLDPKTIPPQIANKHAEWNAFWDPFAVSTMFELFSKVRIFPLDVTDQAKITDEFRAALKAQSQYRYSEFVYQAYQLVLDQPYYEMWNTTAAAYLSGRTDLFKEPQLLPLQMVNWGFEQGSITHNELPGSNLQYCYLNFRNVQNFYDYVLEQLKR